jgi:tripartite-type tricarboxylate transporter receptor subunit TctC
MLKRILLGAAAALALVGATVSGALAQYPDRTIQIVVPYTPGGTVDVLGRLLGQRLTELWGKPVVIINQPGAGGSLGAAAVAGAAPDGYTLYLATNSPLTTNLALYKSLKYDPLRDFEPVIVAGETKLILVANPGFQAKSVAELVQMAKAKPGELNAGTSGRGTTAHLSLAQFNRLAGVELTHVPYRGGVPSLTAAVSGEVQLTFSDIVPAMPMVRDGKLRALASTGKTRAGVAPEIATMAESGLAGFDITAWIAMVAPKGTPKDVVQKLNQTLNQVLKEPAVRDRLVGIGIDPVGGTSEEFAAFLKTEVERWKAIVVQAGIEPE